METSFTSTNAAELERLAPYLTAQRRRDETNVAYLNVEAMRRRGVSWSGMAPAQAPQVRSDAELLAAARADYARAQRPENKLRRQFLHALSDIAENGYAHTADRIRAAYNREIAMEDEAAPDAIGRLQVELLSIPADDRDAAPFVRSALAALAGLLINTAQEAA